MSTSKVFRIVMILAIFLAGTWLLFQSGDLAPETAARQEAVQLALAPGRQGNGTDAATESGQEYQVNYGQPIAPAVVDILTLPSRPAEVDQLKQAYESGQVDLEMNEGPVSDAAFLAMVEESKNQGVDLSVQNYSVGQELDPTQAIQPLALNSGVSFKAIDYTQSQQGVPPDPDLMIGKDHVVVGVNTSFQIFDKTGNSLVGPILYEDFWGTNCATGNGTVVMFDPYSAYDEENGRYVLGITAYDTAVNGGNNGWACIAVSQADSATGSWNLYSFDGNPGGGSDYFFDYPHIGVGQDALYVGANMFGTNFVRNHIFAFEKDVMYAGGSANFIKINVGSNNFTLQPAKLKGYLTGGWPTNSNEPHYFIDSQYGNNQNTLTVWAFSDPWGSPSLTPAGNVTVNTYNLPISQPQLGGSAIQGNDNRLLDVEYWGGKLWATHAVGCNPGGGTVNCIRWYEINISSGSPSLIQQGTFATNSQYNSFPDLGVNACGDMLVGYTKTSTSIYPSVYVAGRETGDPSGQLKDETLVHAGEAVYTAYDSVPRRWGDYTGMVLDPDGTTFWYLGEYSRSQPTARWSTWVSAHSFPGCNIGPTPTPGPTATATNPPPPTNTPGPIACTIYNSTDVPKNIPSNGTPSISSVLSVPSGGTIADVNVISLNGTHTRINDLDFNLSSPGGTSVQIMARSCTRHDNFDLNLDDSASGTWPCPPTGGGTYQPSNPLSAYNGQNSTGMWTLTIDDNANLDGGSLNGWSLEICIEGAPLPTNTPAPPTATNTPAPPTATNTPAPPTNTPPPPTPTNTPIPGGSDIIYVSSTTGGNAGGVSFQDEDILANNAATGQYTMYFDGSDVGVTNDTNAFTVLSDGSLLMSFVNSTTNVPGVGIVEDRDIVRFIPTSIGPNTAGSFELYFDGSDVGLASTAQDVDAVHVLPDGRLVISTIGSNNLVSGGSDEDLLAFTPTSLGTNTSGTWEMYFDGSDVDLSTSREDVYGAWIDSNGDINLTVGGSFGVAEVTGNGADIFVCTPISTGNNTSCTFAMYWDGSVNGYGGETMDGLHIGN